MGFASLVILVIVVFVGSTIQGSLGYGLGLLSVPAFLLLEPEFIPAVPLLLSIPVIVLSLIRDRQSVDVKSFFSLSLGSVPGTAVGSLLLVGLSAFGVKVLAVSVFVVVALLTVFGPKQAFANTAGKVGSGFISSFMGSTTGAGGPILALSFRDVEPSVLRGTLNATGLVAGVFGLVGSVIADRLGTSQFIGAAVFLLPALIGVLLSRVVNRFVMKDRLATIVNASIVLCCVAVVVQVIAEAVIKFV